MTIRRVAFGIILLVAAGAVAVAAPRMWQWWTAPPAGYCPVCHRHEHTESMVKFRAEGEGVIEACCLSCALNYGRQTSKAVTIISVTDYDSRQPLEPDKASFVVGSDVSPCTHLHTEMQAGAEREALPVRWDRCLPNILAFASRDSAEEFRTQHGGRLRNLQEVRNEVAASNVPQD